jgi:hypothetical protein
LLALLGALALLCTLPATAGAITSQGDITFLPGTTRGMKGACLFVKTAEVREVGTTHALVHVLYKDYCAFPGKTSLEVRYGDGDWREVDQTYTKANPGTDWAERDVKISDLPRHSRIWVRTRIDYLGEPARGESVNFLTDGDPARDMHVVGTVPDWSNSCLGCVVSFNLTAVLPAGDGSTAFADWGVGPGYSNSESFCGNCAGRLDNVKVCSPFAENYQRCSWSFGWRLFSQPREAERAVYGLVRGLDYHMRLCLSNPIYLHEFGRQCSVDFALPAVGATREPIRIDVGQAP